MDPMTMDSDYLDPATMDWAQETDAAVIAAADAGIVRAQAELARRSVQPNG